MLFLSLVCLLLAEGHAVERRQLLSVDEGTPITIDNQILTTEIYDEATITPYQSLIVHNIEPTLPEQLVNDKDTIVQLDEGATILPISPLEDDETVNNSEAMNTDLSELHALTTSDLSDLMLENSDSVEIESDAETEQQTPQEEGMTSDIVAQLATELTEFVPEKSEVPAGNKETAYSTTEQSQPSSTGHWYSNLFSYYPTVLFSALNFTSANVSQPLFNLGFLRSWHWPFLPSQQNNGNSARFGFFKRYPVYVVTNGTVVNQTYFIKGKPFHKPFNVTALNSTTIVYNKFGQGPRNFTKFNFFLLKQQRLQQQLLQQQLLQLRQNQPQQVRKQEQEQEQKQEQYQQLAEKQGNKHGQELEHEQHQGQQQAQTHQQQQPPQPLYTVPELLETQQQVDNRLLWLQERAKALPNKVQIETPNTDLPAIVNTAPQQKSDNERTSIMLEIQVPNPLVRLYKAITGFFG